MKAITLHQPWATLLACGAKRVETRTWAPPKALHGERIAIHAGRKRIHKADLHLLKGVAERIPWYKPEVGIMLQIPEGAVVATARLVTAFRVAEGDDQFVACGRQCEPCLGALHVARVDAYGDFSLGRWLWVLDQVEEVDPPVAAKGKQGLWEWE